MRRPWQPALLILLLATLTLGTAAGQPAQQEDTFTEETITLFESLTPEERVGQLFLVTFVGTDAGPDSDIAELIQNYNIGGVLLLAENDNIAGPGEAPHKIIDLNNQIQRIALQAQIVEETVSNDGESLEPLSTPIPDASPSRVPIPLFIATSHEGDGPPFTQIRNDLTELPNPMAIGATWDPLQSLAIGEITGNELSAIGINMLLGPSLDVLDIPRPTSPNDLGTRAFGGDPFWVGLMGQAFTAGVHQGSDGRIAVIAKHFPGYGSSDRPINVEVGTVRKSLEQLKQIELAPFFSVTGEATDPTFVVDGLLTAHVRYQGFQGNIRATTAPVNFDPQALATLMQLPQFANWRQSGGIVVSDELGVRAVQRFYDDTGQEFPHRQVAKDALLAGNDILVLSRFALPDRGFEEQLANIKDTVTWFVDKYISDQTFKQRIDDAVLRILQLKLKLYDGDFSPQSVLANPDNLTEALADGQAIVFDLAQQAITLIAPSPTELVEQLPPAINDDIVIFTDIRQSQQCSDCPPEPWIDKDALEQRLLALYGPQGSEQLLPQQIESYSFAELKEFLVIGPLLPIPAPTPTITATSESGTPQPTPAETPTPAATPTVQPSLLVQSSLERAEWVIFAMLKPDDHSDSSDALHLFLSQRPDIARNANVIVFSYNAPYYLDATEISQLTAYFGVYSKIETFVDASVRALFQESPLRGRSPVNIEAIRYDLFEITKPDPIQVIELFIVNEGTLISPPSEEPLEVMPGATLRLQTGVILDHNGNTVPDGTQVRFVQQDRIQGFVNVIAERPTQDGVANLDYLLEARAGNFRITVATEDATASQEVDIVIGESAIVSVYTPTPSPTHTPSPTGTPTPSLTPTATPSPTPTNTPLPTATIEVTQSPSDDPLEEFNTDWPTLVGLGLGLMLIAGIGSALGQNSSQSDLSSTMRQILWGLAGSLLAYNYFTLGLPGSEYTADVGEWAGFLTTIAGGLIGLLLYHLPFVS